MIWANPSASPFGPERVEWANFIHIYQPPTQKPYWIKKIAEESYRKIIKELRQSPRAKMTVNINACLTELLAKHGGMDVVRDMRFLARRGQIEFTESAKYHPLLPKIPEREIIRQIKLNRFSNRKFFGSAYRPSGFFPPEMACSGKVIAVARKLGYRWIIVDEIAFPSGLPLYDRVYHLEGADDFFVFFRERHFSWRILSAQIGTGPALVREIKAHRRPGMFLLTAMDGETFGHHRPGLERLLFDVHRSPFFETVTISELFDRFPRRIPVTPRDSTWAMMPKDVARNAPFSRWYDPGNEIQARQWELTNLAIRAVGANAHTPGWRGARQKLDRALHSDQYWWASARPWWSLEMIERGAKELVDAVHALDEASPGLKRRAYRLYLRIITAGFEWQRSGKVEAISRQEDEELRQRLEEKGKPYLTKKDYLAMIRALREEMLNLARHGEYDRASLIKKRIAELQEDMLRASRSR